MRALRLFFGGAALVTLALACSGDAGPAGPEGLDGNANIQMYEFGSRTFTGSQDYVITGLSQGLVDSSLVLIYYNPSTEAPTAWYPVPGFGSTGAYQTRFFTFQSAPDPSTYTFGVRLLEADGVGTYTTQVTFTKLKIFIVPTSSIVSLSTGQPLVDLGNYNAVSQYLGARR